MNAVPTVTVQTQLPVPLFEAMQRLVALGWYKNADDLLLDALRRLLESHRVELIEEFIREDVAWGLYGSE